jgi:hypothetical protein
MMRSLIILVGLALISLSKKDQRQVDLTVYNNFAVVREIRRTILPRGIVDVDYQDVPSTIDPTTVRATSVGKEDLFGIEQQTYHYDLLNRKSLLEHYIGRKLKYSRNIQENGTYERVLREGILLSIDPEIVKFGDEVEISPEGVISLPYIPEGLRTIPTLTWRINNRVKGVQSIETSYLAGGFSWDADYRLDLNSDETSGDLSVWVGVQNQSGADYDGADIHLVAGDVRRAEAPRPIIRPETAMMRMQSDKATGQPFFEYYMYTMRGPVDLKNNEKKQFRLMSAENVRVTKSYVLTTEVGSRQIQEPIKNRFDVQFAFENTTGSGLGTPLPKGKFRVFKSDSSGAPQLLGEDYLPHTSRAETASVTVGKAFDLMAEHTQTGYRRVGERGVEVGYKISLRNRKNHKVSVILNEKFYGDWSITQQSESGKRIDSTTEQFVLTLEPGSERSLTYTARIGY